MDTRVKTVTGPTSIMVRVEVQRQWEGDLCGGWTRGCKGPLGRVSKGGYPLIPPLFKGANGLDGKARDPGYEVGLVQDSLCPQLVFEDGRLPRITG